MARSGLLVGCVLALAGSTLIHATATIIVRTDKSVYVGTDSLRQLGNRQRTGLGCKIHRFGSVYVATSGIVEFPSMRFVLRDHTEAAAKSTGLIATRISQLDHHLLPTLKAIAQRLRTREIEFRERYLNQPFVQVAFFAIENDLPVVVERKYVPTVAQDNNLTIKVHACPSAECPEAATVYLLGGNSATVAQLNRDSRYFLDRDTPSAIRELIELEIQRRPASVGPPINILRITRDGSQWLEGGGVCGQL